MSSYLTPGFRILGRHFFILPAMLKSIQNFDLRITHALAAHRAPKALEQLLRFYVRMGDGYIWIPVLAFVIYKWGFNTLLNASGQIITTVGMSIAMYWILKLSIKRTRPYNKLKELKEGVASLDRYSFPSGHTMNNMAAACIAYTIYPPVGTVMLILPLTFGLLRVYFCVHWLSDILAGFFIGILMFALSRPLFDFIQSLF